MSSSQAEKKIINMAKKAKAAALKLALVSSADKNKVLKIMAKALIKESDYLIKENQKDLRYAVSQSFSKALIDRLTLNEKRIQGMAQCLVDTVKIKDPVGDIMKVINRPNGLVIKKVRTPIGVVGIIYESRPNVTSDCIGLCLKSGNAVILKGGKEAYYSNKAIFTVLRKVLKESKIPEDSIQQVASTDRAAITILLKQDEYVDMIVPRGGESLIRFVAENSRIPVVKHYKGICHIYVSHLADLQTALSISVNAKVQRPGVCNAMETLLVHEKIASKFLPKLAKEYLELGVEIRGDAAVRKILGKDAKSASSKDWDDEYLDLIISIKIVKDVDSAIDHINIHGSRHTDAIITKNNKEADHFMKSVDSSSVMVNASTRFSDGYEYGFGAEVGISTDKLHARGPMALEELTTYKYLVYGKGQIRQ